MSMKLSPLAGRKVLVIDDEGFSRSIIYNYCLGLGAADVLRASNGADAIEALVGPPLDLAICDFNMPGVNGLEFLKAVRIGYGGIANDFPVIMLTGNSDATLVGAALSLDVDAFLVKPISKLALADRIQRALAGRRDIREPEHYMPIDVKAVSAALRKAAAGRPAEIKSPTVIPEGARIAALDEIVPPAVLAQELRLPSGEILLPAETAVTSRLLDRLRELVPLGIPCDHLIIW